jgi:glycosyltransferase involved in cell wall biosynthesis
MANPTVSVVIPSYNSARFVGEAIESVLAQSYEGFELIVVDDGSTDNTRDVVARYTDPRVRYVYQENQERSAARNRGIREARGKYVAFLDADDLWLPKKLAEQVRLMESQPDVGLAYVGTYVVEEDGTPFFEQRCRHRGNVVRALLVEDNIVAGSASSAMVRRACFERAGFFDESLSVCEDWDVWLRIASHYPVDFVDRPLVKVRTHGGSTQKQAEKMRQGTLAFFDRVLSDPSLENEVRPVRRQVRSLALFMVGRAYYAAREMRLARRYFLQSVRAYPLQWRAWQYGMRSLVGPQWTERLRWLRNRAAQSLRFRKVA